MVAAYLSLYFLFFQTRHQLLNNKDKLSKAFRLLDRVQSIKETAERLRENRHQNELSHSVTASHGGLWQKFKTEVRWWRTLRDSIRINRWDPEKSILTDDGEKKVNALQLWERLQLARLL